MSLLYKLSQFFSAPCQLICPFTGSTIELQSNSTVISKLSTQSNSTFIGKKQLPMLPLSSSNYSVRFYTSIHKIDRDWETATSPNNRFLQRDYLSILEDNPPVDMRFVYWVFYESDSKNQKQAVGVAVGQIVRFKVANNIKVEEDASEIEKKSIVKSVKNKLTKWVAGNVGVNLLIVGSTLLTGEHAYYFNNKSTHHMRLQLIQEALDVARKELAKNNIVIDGNMIKDFNIENHRIIKKKLVQQHHYSEFEFQPSMILDLRKEWTCFEDYLNAMSSKYRVRARRAHKKGNELTKQSLSADEIRTQNDKIYQLYQNVVDTADVNMAQLHPNYFLELKEELGDDFQLIGWYLKGELIGFHTLIDNYHELEAHFLGLNHEFNRSHQLYLNMLYEMTAYGINNGHQQVCFARTALEIKSSIGAEPHRMLCYVRHSKNLPNLFLKSAVSYFEPNVEWKQRHPFK